MSKLDLTDYMAISVRSGCVSGQYQTDGKGPDIIVIPKDYSEYSGVFPRSRA